MNEATSCGSAEGPAMAKDRQGKGLWIAIGLIFLVVPTALAAATGLWVLTAISIGFLFGFFLQKGDLCGASAISEVILFRDRRKAFGFWVAIVTSMLVFAALDLLGVVKLNPKPLFWVNTIVGGIIFGAGTVLAGGCVSGCLYKAGAGNLNSIVALLGIPLGVAAVLGGPLSGMNHALKKVLIKAEGGAPVTVSTLTGLPFWVLALLFAAITLAATLWWRARHPLKEPTGDVRRGRRRNPLFRSWKPWTAGLAIGLLAIVAWPSSAASGRNYPLGVTHGVYDVEVLAFESNLIHVYQPAAARPAPKTAPALDLPQGAVKKAPARPKGHRVFWWLVALVVALMAGSHVSARLSGQSMLLPREPGETLVALFGGILVGAGAATGGGCMIGNVLSGIGQLSVAAIPFTICTVLANWAVTYYYLMGGTWPFRGAQERSS